MGRRVHFGSLYSFRRTLEFSGFIWGAVLVVGFIPIHSEAPWVFSGSFGFVRLVLTRPWRGRVHCCSLGSI